MKTKQGSKLSALRFQYLNEWQKYTATTEKESFAFLAKCHKGIEQNLIKKIKVSSDFSAFIDLQHLASRKHN